MYREDSKIWDKIIYILGVLYIFVKKKTVNHLFVEFQLTNDFADFNQSH